MTPTGATNRCASPRPPAALPDPCGPEHRSATGRVDDQPGEMARPPMKEGTGQSTLRLPVARTESRLSARAPDPPPLAQNDATSLRTSPGKITNDPAEIVNTNRPDNRQRSRRTQPTARTTPTQKSGLNPDAEDATTSPEGPSGYVKTNYLQLEPRQERGGHRNTANHQTRPQKVPPPPAASSPNPNNHGRSAARSPSSCVCTPNRPSARGWRTTTATAPIRGPARRPRNAATAPTRSRATSQGRGATP